MNALATWLNVVAYLVISLTCWSFLLASTGKCWVSRSINLWLLLLAVGAFAAAFVPVVRGEQPQWWELVLSLVSAVVAFVLYQRRFGVGAQLRALWRHYRDQARRLAPLFRQRPQPDPTEFEAEYDALCSLRRGFYRPPSTALGANHDGRDL